MPEQTSYYQRVLEQTLGFPFSNGNKVKVLKNGVEIFPAMLDAIRNAKKKIEFLTFIYWTGDIAYEFANTLAEKAEEGVEVHVLLDSFGSQKMPADIPQIMKSKGVLIEWFRPVSHWKVWKIDNRTHRKVLICDGEVAFTGGVGIGEEWEGDARNENEWRETHFRIEGPAVDGLHAAFMENWIETGRDLELAIYDKPNEDRENRTKIQVIRTTASVRWSDIVMLYQTLIRMARENIRITTAYFNPNSVMIDLLKEASRRGIDIRIIVPGDHTDHEIAKIAGEDSFNELLEAGIQIWYYQKTMIHSKVITVDDAVSCVGSANFNHRSMLKDDEINMVIIDRDITGQLNIHFEEDLTHCEKINMKRWKKRGPLKKIKEKFAQLLNRQI